MEKEEVQAKFQIGDILPIGMTLVVLVVGIAVGMDVLGDVKTDFTAGSAAYNATSDGEAGILKITSKLPIIGTAVAFAVILGILVRYLMVRMG